MLQIHCSEKLEMARIHTFVFILLSLIFVYDFFFESNIAYVRIKDPKFSFLGPYNTTTVKTNDVYHHLIDIKNFRFKVNPQPCRVYTQGLLLVIIVTSNPVNFENRVIIRETWGKSVDSTKVVFLMGETPNATLAMKIQKESNMYGDIVQGTFVDAYRNMTYKHVMGLKWVTHHCPMAKYILKADDDIVVNARGLRRFLVQELSPWGVKGLIACQMCEHALAYRTNSSKWMVSMKEYGQDYYPTYCAGWSILYSQDVVTKLLEAAQVAPYFWIDDVHVTGIIAEKIGLTPTSMSGLFLSPIKADLLVRLKNLANIEYMSKYILGPTDLSSAKMLQIWRAIPA